MNKKDMVVIKGYILGPEEGVTYDGGPNKYQRALDRIAELEAEVRAYLMDGQEPTERSQEAAHYNWLDDKIEKLEKENKLMKDALKIYATSEYVDVKHRDRDSNGDEILIIDDNGEIARQALKDVEGVG